MVTLELQTSGGGIEGAVAKFKRDLNHRMGRALAHSVAEWKQLVISSTWVSSRPSPSSKIIAIVRRIGEGEWTLTYGWVHYKGNQGRAVWRLSLREWMYSPKMRERVQRAMAGV